MFWNGFKVHISETCATKADDAARPAPEAAATAGAQAPDKPSRAPIRPNLITNIATTASTVPDSKALEGIHRSQQQRGLLPDKRQSLITPERPRGRSAPRHDGCQCRKLGRGC